MTTTPRPDADARDQPSQSSLLDRSWDENAKAWTATVREGRIESRRIATDRAIIDAVVARRPERILDVGCGEGWLCRALGERGLKCVGVDGSSELIRAARSADPDGEYHVLDFCDFSRLSEVVQMASANVVVCNFALLHEEISPILVAAHGILRPHGTLLIQTVHPWTASETSAYVDGWRTEDFAWAACPFPRPMPWYFRTLGSWTAAVREGGFMLESVTEPAHPGSGMPLSLLLSAIRPGV